MKKTIKGKLLSEIPKKIRYNLPDDTVIKCIETHSFIFDSGIFIRDLSAKKGETDRLGWRMIKNDKLWKIHKIGKNKSQNN